MAKTDSPTSAKNRGRTNPVDSRGGVTQKIRPVQPPPPPPAAEPGPAAGVEPAITLRGNIKTWHHLFKAGVSKTVKPEKWPVPAIREIEHVHFFHTVNSSGAPQKYTSATAGHVHEVTHGYDSEGKPYAKCGPPLKKVTRPGRGGLSKTAYEAIRFENPTGDGEDYIVDRHSHAMDYQGSDEISRAKIEKIQQDNSEKIGRVAGVKIAGEPAALTAEDGITMSEADGSRTKE